MPNPLSTYILNISDLVWLSFMTYRPFEVLMKNITYTSILNIYDLFRLSFMAYQPLLFI